MNEKYLITGGSGKLGTHLKEFLSCETPTHQQFDITDPKKIRNYLNEDYKAVIHLAAISDQQYAANHQKESYIVNVLGCRNLAKIANEKNLKIIYISTDYVFPGTKGNYSETDLPSPANWYGYTKLAGEWEIRLNSQNWCIIRTSFRPLKWSFPTAFTNVFTSADYVDVIANEIFLCSKMNIEGIIHIGTQKKSFYDLAIKMNKKIEPELCTLPDFQKNRDLCIEKWSKLKEMHGF